MGYSQFLYMVPEATLTAMLIIVFIADFMSAKKDVRKWFNPFVCVLMLAQVLITIATQPVYSTITAFGGMYTAGAAANVMKTILAAGTLIVLIQSRQWMSRQDTAFKEGEFYMLVISTLLGMNMMMSAGHFLMFFLGLEMASVPMACLVGLDKYRHHSAEAAAKYILTATFSSGIMLYGISMLYAATGTLYFDNFAQNLQLVNKPLSLVGLVFFFSGLGFKISLVPFHFWTADTYQGAPTTVTGYLSVISKGAAAFTLMTILMKVFAPMTHHWTMMLYVVIVLSITVANLFAIRQSELKRFMAFSSISQAGYIMLAVIGNNDLGITALTYYVLVYVVANLAVFTVIAAVEENNGGRTPPFAGMFSKFFVFMAAASHGTNLAYFVVFIALINTVISLYYYLLIVKAMYIKQTDSPLPTFKSDCGTKLALAICTLGIALFGVCSFFYNWIYSLA